MTPGEKLFGFSVTEKRYVEEINSTVYSLVHDECGASLVYFERDDDNKTFAVSFTTLPEDDTGVFHIIEHSVLCGSEKYPLRDPFAELLKSSLNTFLNAVTYEDRTVYPVSSVCDRDFYNLVSVYLDAVFAPLMLKNKKIFMQEGWHHEYDAENDSVIYNGVVYNEMKGAYSSADDVGAMELSKALFAGTPYEKDSGGDPRHIPSLTYEKFKDSYEKCYHPSKAKIILDGRIRLDEILPLINSYLSGRGRRECTTLFKKSTPKISEMKRVKYKISENESPSSRARLLLGYVCSDFSDKEAYLTALILADVLCSTNASPLKKALLEKGLAKDAFMYTNRSYELSVTLEIRDIDEEKVNDIVETVEKVIRNMAREGVGKEKLCPVLNSLEFKLRENDHGTLPTGISNAMAAFGFWNYGERPENALLFFDSLKALREKIDTDYFERTLLEMTVDNPHRASVLMIPDGRADEEFEADEKNRLSSAEIKNAIPKIKEEADALKAWQSEDEEDALVTLPSLSISDIPPKKAAVPLIESEVDNAKILSHGIETNGIVYISLLFNASDLTAEELSTLAFLSSAYQNFPTAKRDVLTLQNEAKANLGALYTSCAVGTKSGVATPYLKVSSSFLQSKENELLDILADMLLTTDISDISEVKNIVAQTNAQIEDAIISSGESVALARVEAACSAAGIANEYLNGYELYKLTKRIKDDEVALTRLAKSAMEIAKKIITKNRLTLFVSGKASDGFAEKIVDIIPSGKGVSERAFLPPCAESYEYFVTPTKVAYAVMGGSYPKVTDSLGVLRIARTVLSYEYLWSKIRVMGGAYGTGFIARRDGTVSFYSYRDPSPANSLAVYPTSAEYLRALADSGEDITKFIIGTIGEFDTVRTPRTSANIAVSYYINGWSDEKEAQVRKEMLSVKVDDLRCAADIIDKISKDPCIAIVGSREHLKTLKNPPKSIIEI